MLMLNIKRLLRPLTDNTYVLCGLTFLLCLLAVHRAHAQETAVITDDNADQLTSVAQIDFADYDAPIDAGWFAMNADGTHYLLRDTQGTLYLVDDRGDLRETFRTSPTEDASAILVDAVFADDMPYILEITDGETTVNGSVVTAEFPFALWVDDDALYIETSAIGTNDGVITRYRLPNLSDTETIPYAPASDPDGVVRIGRIPLPYVITSSLAGVVTLWDVQNGTQRQQVDNGTGQPAVFGNINQSATHLVWRDNDNRSLYVLDFETGENRYIDDLGGAYAQWYFLSPDASVIIAVNLEFEPIVVMWDVASGNRTDLGDYRTCERPQPDMARLSDDGTTLVIGCDTGLDIWRVPVDPTESD